METHRIVHVVPVKYWGKYELSLNPALIKGLKNKLAELAKSGKEELEYIPESSHGNWCPNLPEGSVYGKAVDTTFETKFIVNKEYLVAVGTSGGWERKTAPMYWYKFPEMN